jgi:hypothetical protein
MHGTVTKLAFHLLILFHVLTMFIYPHTHTHSRTRTGSEPERGGG